MPDPRFIALQEYREIRLVNTLDFQIVFTSTCYSFLDVLKKVSRGLSRVCVCVCVRAPSGSEAQRFLKGKEKKQREQRCKRNRMHSSHPVQFRWRWEPGGSARRERALDTVTSFPTPPSWRRKPRRLPGRLCCKAAGAASGMMRPGLARTCPATGIYDKRARCS